MRGEEREADIQEHTAQELPPHARRRGVKGKGGHTRLGITSACAEKRQEVERFLADPGNYLRMRGEEHSRTSAKKPTTELPPHARRRGRPGHAARVFIGITSACAEKSQIQHRIRRHSRNYLRMRGEEAPLIRSLATAWELPPHARRRAGSIRPAISCQGITSACAEKRPPPWVVVFR